MKNPPLSPGAQLSVAAMTLLGMVGGGLIVAYSGFGTSPKHGGSSTFVPVPQAYFLAAMMYGMSFIGMLALLQSRKASWLVTALAVVLYAAVATLLVLVLNPN